jgi:trehalose-6-phosphatase
MVFIRKDLVYKKMDREIESLIAATEALPKDQKLLLLLDDDGTLVEIAPRPELARPTQELVHVLGRLSSLPGLALVVVSGRSLKNLGNFSNRRPQLSGLSWCGGADRSRTLDH